MASAKGESEDNQRIAIVSEDKCKPKKCKQECKRSCPVVLMGALSWVGWRHLALYCRVRPPTPPPPPPPNRRQAVH